MVERVTRYDAGRPLKATRLDNGWLKAPATITRVGVFAYRQADGTVRRELRLPEEVFKVDSLASLEQVPVTLEHPATPTGLLDAESTKRFAVGHVGDRIDYDTTHVKGRIMVHDAKAVAEVEGGRQQVSAGYTTKLDFSAGVHPVFGPYDAIQRDIVYNHVAITKAGRAGPSVRLHLDSDAAEVIEPDPEDISPSPRSDSMAMAKVKIGGVEFEVSEQAAQAFAAEQTRRDAERDHLKARADSAEAERDQAKARADQAEQARKDAADPDKIKAAVAARVDLERKAAPILGNGVKLDTLSDRDLMVAVVEKVTPAVKDKLTSASDEYVRASFDIASASFKPAANPAIGAPRADASANAEATRTDAESARKKMIEDHRNAWKRDLSKGVN